MQQSHILNDRSNFTDYLMYVPCDIPPSEVTFVRVTKIAEAAAADNKTQSLSQKQSLLSVEGFSEDDEVLFKYQKQNLT